MSEPVRREIPRPRGAGRAVVVTLVILLALLAALDLGLRFWAEQWFEDRIEEGLGLSKQPDLSLGGFPFLPAFARGRLTDVSLEMRDVAAGDLAVDRLRLEFRDVVFDRSDLLARRPGQIAVGRGLGELELGETALNEVLGGEGAGVTVELVGPRVRATTVIGTASEETVSARGRVRLEDGALVFEPRRLEAGGSAGVTPEALAFEIPLPELLPGLTYESVEVREELLVLSVRFEGATIDLVRTG